jgi:hypothetical protein
MKVATLAGTRRSISSTYLSNSALPATIAISIPLRGQGRPFPHTMLLRKQINQERSVPPYFGGHRQLRERLRRRAAVHQGTPKGDYA